MKLYIRAAISIENLENQFGKDIPKPVIRQIINLDPTSNPDSGKGGKYCRWLLELYKKGNLVKNDFGNVKDALMMYADDSTRKKFPKTDIMQYKTFDEFLQDCHTVGNMPETAEEAKRRLKKEAHRASDADKKFLVEDDTWMVWQALTHAGNMSLARYGDPDGTHKAGWCTAYEGKRGEGYFNDYSSQDNIYVFIPKQNPIDKYQSCPGSGSWWFDKDDREHGKDAFFDFCAEHPKIAEYFNVMFTGGVTTFRGKVVGYDKNATTITVPDGMVALPNFPVPDACTKVILPDSITNIPSRAFINSNVVTLEANNLERIGPNAFNSSAITNIDLSGVNGRIGSNAFSNCKNLTNVTLGTPSIGPCAFAGSGIVAEVTITPEMHLDMMAFNGCPNVIVTWDKEDEAYRFFDTSGKSSIKLLRLNPEKCPKLFEMNDGKVDMEQI